MLSRTAVKPLGLISMLFSSSSPSWVKELGPKLRALGVPVGRTGLAGPGLGESPAELFGILRVDEVESNT